MQKRWPRIRLVGIFSALFASGFFWIFDAPGANADDTRGTLHACKKRHPLVYSSFTWAVIEKAPDSQLTFHYGNGLSDQMLEIFFASPIEEIAPGRYEGGDADYALSVEIRESRLSFTVKTARDSETRKSFRCD